MDVRKGKPDDRYLPIDVFSVVEGVLLERVTVGEELSTASVSAVLLNAIALYNKEAVDQ